MHLCTATQKKRTKLEALGLWIHKLSATFATTYNYTIITKIQPITKKHKQQALMYSNNMKVDATRREGRSWDSSISCLLTSSPSEMTLQRATPARRRRDGRC